MGFHRPLSQFAEPDVVDFILVVDTLVGVPRAADRFMVGCAVVQRATREPVSSPV